MCGSKKADRNLSRFSRNVKIVITRRWKYLNWIKFPYFRIPKIIGFWLEFHSFMKNCWSEMYFINLKLMTLHVNVFHLLKISTLTCIISLTWKSMWEIYCMLKELGRIEIDSITLLERHCWCGINIFWSFKIFSRFYFFILSFPVQSTLAHHEMVETYRLLRRTSDFLFILF